MARWPWTSRALALAGVAAIAWSATAGDDAARLRFARHGVAVSKLGLDALHGVAPAATVRVFEPYEGREVPFAALPFAELLDAVYGEGWRSEQELLFRCRDGYQPTVPVQRVLDHRPWLAFARRDQQGFTIRKRESGERKTVDLSPFYLVWENLDDARIRQEADYGWPYQLVGVDLIRTRDRFPGLAPAPDASGEVRAGFRAFRVHCSKCHALNGEGGSLGPPLSPGLLARNDRAWLRSWIEDPSRVRANARMPALNPALPDRARTVDQILAYLEAKLEGEPGAG